METSLAASKPSPDQIRQELVDLMLADLVGPKHGPEEEVVEERRVRDRYPIGAIAPKGARIDPVDDDDFITGGDVDNDQPDEATADAKVPMQRLPTSIGLTFTVDANVKDFVATATWGQYLREQSDTEVTESGNPKLVWKRYPRGGSPVYINLAKAIDDPKEKFGCPDPEFPEVVLTGKVRQQGNNYWIVTLFLKNEQPDLQQSKDKNWLFQAEIEVSSGDGSPIFVSRPINATSISDDEQRELNMLYRDAPQFAVGHGIAVHAEGVDTEARRARSLVTKPIPVFELHPTVAPEPDDENRLGDLELDMYTLASTQSGGFAQALDPLVHAYRLWIKKNKLEMQTAVMQDHTQAASESIQKCETALARIEEGIQLLDENPQAAKAFQFANRAMGLQRQHTQWASARKAEDDKKSVTYEDFDIPKNRTWRPFQLAFILSCIPGLADLEHPDRSTDESAIADLLWFPTGGGKTEAYLGLTAFTIAIRRLQGQVEGYDGSDGVAVIMRYTLRLLTLQQFQRATALMCACESLRQQDASTWGEVPIRIGLWVGTSMTPNYTEQADKALKNKSNQGYSSVSGNPHQLTDCPWCGSSIEKHKDVEVEKFSGGRGRTIHYCGDKSGRCEFSRKRSRGEGIPVLVIDEEIYRNPPSLLIATVDKFAQMTWKGAIRNLFGKVEKRCERHGYIAPDYEDASFHRKTETLPAAKTVDVDPLRPPDLIIQDELHLISGPLGSMVGLFETALDGLCTWEVNGKKVRPKVIASTATIRRANEQVRNLYMREVQTFPPNGISATDNFFAKQIEPTDRIPGRLYLGVCARGVRLKQVLIRVYLSLLSSAQVLLERYGEDADTYMTLVGYFGSLRELGGMRRLLDDEIKQRLGYMDRRGLSNRRMSDPRELTSRLKADDVPRVLAELEKKHPRRKEHYPVDVLLATNMISVGVDVGRLGLMVVAGQPKTTSEYIQATSRVGRNTPGVVVTVYNWARPRDLSHYESFEHYHETLYKQVEPISVTPFAPRAIDRALTSVLASSVRLSHGDLAENDGAGMLRDHRDHLAAISNEILARSAVVAKNDSLVESIVSDGLTIRLKDWLNTAAESMGLVSWDKNTESTVLLKHAGDGPWTRFTALDSLRNVESGVNLVLDQDKPWPRRQFNEDEVV